MPIYILSTLICYEIHLFNTYYLTSKLGQIWSIWVHTVPWNSTSPLLTGEKEEKSAPKMADGGSQEAEKTVIHEDVLQGSEPGASRSSILMPSDDEEDLHHLIEEQLEISPRNRLSSGTIRELASQGDETLRPKTPSGDTSADSGGTTSHDSSNRTTPSTEINAQVVYQLMKNLKISFKKK